MSTNLIGRWFARFATTALTESRLTKVHLCESEVADRKITRCGHEMGSIEGTALRAVEPEGWTICQYCAEIDDSET